MVARGTEADGEKQIKEVENERGGKRKKRRRK